MAKRGRTMPPLDFNDLERVILADGWYPVPGTKHENYETSDEAREGQPRQEVEEHPRRRLGLSVRRPRPSGDDAEGV